MSVFLTTAILLPPIAFPRTIYPETPTIPAGTPVKTDRDGASNPGETVPLTYQEALHRVPDHNPGLRLQALRAERDLRLVDQHSTLLPAAPELEASLDRGTIHYPAGVLEQVPAAESHNLRGYEIGLRQQVDLSGLRSTRREAAIKQSVLSQHMTKAEQLQARAHVRHSYLAVSVHGGMAEHLGEHIHRFTRLRQIIGPGYFDRRLGAYTSSALEMGIAALLATKAESLQAERTALIDLQMQLGLSEKDTLRLEGFRDVKLPDVPADERLVELALNGWPLLLGQDRLELAKAEEEFAKRRIFPFVELFAAAGRRDVGTYTSLSASNNSPQREDYLRFGFRVPLGAAGPDRTARNVAEVETRMAAEELRILRERLSSRVRAEAEIYRTQRQRYAELLRTFERGEPMLQAIEAALVSRRVTYFEFWSEHERLHDILIKLGESRLKAADALGNLEVMTSTEFE